MVRGRKSSSEAFAPPAEETAGGDARVPKILGGVTWDKCPEVIHIEQILGNYRNYMHEADTHDGTASHVGLR